MRAGFFFLLPLQSMWISKACMPKHTWGFFLARGGCFGVGRWTTDLRLEAEDTWPKPETAHEKSLSPEVTQEKW